MRGSSRAGQKGNFRFGGTYRALLPRSLRCHSQFSGDAQGSERGLEYDTMSGRYAEFVETEVLPFVER